MFFDDQSLTIPCSNCQTGHTKTVKWLKTHSEIKCEGCGVTIHLESSDFRRKIREAEQQIKDLGKLIKTTKIGAKF